MPHWWSRSSAVARLVVLAALLAVLVTFATIVTVRAQSGSDAVYTEEQASSGATLYDEQCVSCHGSIRQLVPEMATLLADHTFRARWSERSLGELFELIQVEMPQDAPGSLTVDETSQLLAFILQGNRRPAGEHELSRDIEVLKTMPFDPGP